MVLTGHDIPVISNKKRTVNTINTENIHISTAITTSSFESIFKLYYKALCQYAFSLVKSREDAEEIVQQVFFKIWEQREIVMIELSAKAYLYRSVYNHCLNHLKHVSVQQTHQKYLNSLPVPLAANTETRVLGRELGHLIKTALAELPEQCGLIFRLSRYEGLKYGEIAQKLGLSVKTVEAQMGKALRLMRLKLVEYLPLWLVLCLLR